MNPGTFAAVFVALYAGHMIGDHIAQTDDQAAGKSAATGWLLPMAGHLAGYGLSQAIALAALIALDVPMSAAGILAGLTFSIATHGFIDRRWPVRWLLRHTGSARFADLADHGMNGPYLADQSLHIGCLFVAAFIAAGGAA